jgi:hypothetical protein
MKLLKKGDMFNEGNVYLSYTPYNKYDRIIPIRVFVFTVNCKEVYIPWDFLSITPIYCKYKYITSPVNVGKYNNNSPQFNNYCIGLSEYWELSEDEVNSILAEVI